MLYNNEKFYYIKKVCDYTLIKKKTLAYIV